MSNGKGTKQRCGVCGFHMRGDNHEDGKHHKAEAAKPRLEQRGYRRSKNAA
jgi:hypothetical protein